MQSIFSMRARQLVAAKELLENDREFAYVTALLAIHAAIALNDALLTVWLGAPVKSADHEAAADFTLKACRLRQEVDERGVQHLRTLLRNKTDVSYGDRLVTFKKAQALAETAERFRIWTYKVCKELTG